MKYARYTAGTGAIEGLYDTAVHNTIPSRTVEITDEEWSNIVSNPGKYIIDITTATLIEKEQLTLSEIKAHRTSGEQRVDAAAEDKRRTYLTLTVGQDTIYMWKYDEAKAFVFAGGNGNLDQFPLLKADYEAFEEADISMSPLEVAQRVIDQHDAAKATAVALEKVRRSAKERIAKAKSRAVIDDIVENALSEMESI